MQEEKQAYKGKLERFCSLGIINPLRDVDEWKKGQSEETAVQVNQMYIFRPHLDTQR